MGVLYDDVEAEDTADTGEGSRGGGLGASFGLGKGVFGALIGGGAPPCCSWRAAMRSLSDVNTGSSSAMVIWEMLIVSCRCQMGWDVLHRMTCVRGLSRDVPLCLAHDGNFQ